MKSAHCLIALTMLGLLADGRGWAETNGADAARSGQQAARHSAAAANQSAQPVLGKPKRVPARPLTQHDTSRPSFSVRNVRGRVVAATLAASGAASAYAGPPQNQHARAGARFTPIAPKANGVAGVSGAAMRSHATDLAVVGGPASTMPKAGGPGNARGPHGSALTVLGGPATFDARKLVRR
jgi:hypothetical protein